METTSDYAQAIADAVLSHNQARALELFTLALADHCTASSLLAEIGEKVGAGRALIMLAAAYIEQMKGQRRENINECIEKYGLNGVLNAMLCYCDKQEGEAWQRAASAIVTARASVARADPDCVTAGNECLFY